MNKTNKQAELQIGGRKVKVNFGVNYFYKHFLEATGIDLIANGVADADIASIKMFNYLAGFIYAGHNAECSITKTKCDLSFEDVSHEVMSMDEKGATELLWECFSILTAKSVKELKNVQAQAAKKNGKAEIAAEG